MYNINILDTELILDQVALNFFNIAITLCPNPTLINCTKEWLSNCSVVWDGESISDLAIGLKISEHNWSTKLTKIDDFKNIFLSKKAKDTTILVVKDLNRKEKLIIDGIHRSVGYFKALQENESAAKNINFKAIFFESEKICEMYDFKRIFGT